MVFHDFISRKSKGSKRIRCIKMSAIFVDQNKKKRACPIKNYLQIAGVAEGPVECYTHLNALWTIHFLPSEFKTFLFKAHHNILGLNNRVNHINPDRPATCTFCTKALNLPAERESFSHFFWYCPTSTKIIDKFFENYIEGDKNITLFFSGCVSRQNKLFHSRPLSIVFNILRFILWNFKLRKKLPTWPSAVSEFFYLFNIILKCSRKFQEEVYTCNYLKRNRE
jgi:hypothetical protein